MVYILLVHNKLLYFFYVCTIKSAIVIHKQFIHRKSQHMYSNIYITLKKIKVHNEQL